MKKPINFDEMRLLNIGKHFNVLLHEINNPLTAALLQVDVKEVNRKLLKNNLVYIKNNIDSFRSYIGGQESNSLFYIDRQINLIKPIIEPISKFNKVNIIYTKAPHLKLHGDKIKFQQILINLLINAIESYSNFPSEKVKDVIISMNKRTDYIFISIHDWGKQIENTYVNKIFNLYSSTKDNKITRGIGLTITKENLKTFSGSQIKVISHENIGTIFRLRFKLN